MVWGTWRPGDPISSCLRCDETVSTHQALGRTLLRPHSLGIRGGPQFLSKAPSPSVSQTPASLQGSSTPLGAATDEALKARNGSLIRSLVPLCPQCTGTSRKAARPLIFPRIQFKEAAGPAIGSAHGPTKPRLREKRLRVTDGGICGPTGWAAGRRALPLANQSSGRGSGRSEARVG